jgi:ribonuclease VapC
MSIASYLEAGTVLAGRRRHNRLKAIDELDAFLLETGIDLVSVDIAQGRLALSARIVHGRGMGSGGMLNFGDTFSYALAKSRAAPLLFIGNDFAATDIKPALAPE